MGTVQTLTIGTREFFALVDAVVPYAANDLGLPILSAVRIESRGSHLLAMTTDRYRIGIKRLAAAEGEQWPDFSATIPLASVRAIKQMFRPMRGLSPDLTLTARSDDGQIDIEAGGALLDALSARATFLLALGEYPKFLRLIIDGLARKAEPFEALTINPKLLADFTKVNTYGLHIKPDPKKPLIFTDGADFIGALMPRPRAEASGTFPDMSDWSALLEPPEPVKAKRTTRKKVA